MIKIKKSPTADTRTCDWCKVSEQQLVKSTEMHIDDVAQGMNYFIEKMKDSIELHDHDKLSEIKWFHHDFKTGFKEQSWWNNHKRVNRHHIQDEDGIPDDINLVDVLEHIVDCVMACKARGGEFKDIELPNDLLQKAVKNTTQELLNNVEVHKNENE